MSTRRERGADSRQRDLGAAALGALALIWGYGWVLTKVGLDYMEPFTFAAFRSVLSVLCLFALLLLLLRPLRPVALGLTLLVGLLQTSGFTACTMWALAHTGAGRTAVLVYTMPFWLLLLAGRSSANGCEDSSGQPWDLRSWASSSSLVPGGLRAYRPA